MREQDNMATLILLQRISVDTNSIDREGRLVFANGLLIAVLVRLDAPDYDQGPGWFMEAGFGRLQGMIAPTFESLEEATKWLRGHIMR